MPAAPRLMAPASAPAAWCALPQTRKSTRRRSDSRTWTRSSRGWTRTCCSSRRRSHRTTRRCVSAPPPDRRVALQSSTDELGPLDATFCGVRASRTWWSRLATWCAACRRSACGRPAKRRRRRRAARPAAAPHPTRSRTTTTERGNDARGRAIHLCCARPPRFPFHFFPPFASDCTAICACHYAKLRTVPTSMHVCVCA